MSKFTPPETQTKNMGYLIVDPDIPLKRHTFYSCNLKRFTYYKDHATVFDTQGEAEIVKKYFKLQGTTMKTNAVSEDFT